MEGKERIPTPNFLLAITQHNQLRASVPFDTHPPTFAPLISRSRTRIIKDEQRDLLSTDEETEVQFSVLKLLNVDFCSRLDIP